MPIHSIFIIEYCQQHLCMYSPTAQLDSVILRIFPNMFCKTLCVNEESLWNRIKQWYRPLWRKWHGAGFLLCFPAVWSRLKASPWGALCGRCCSRSLHGNPPPPPFSRSYLLFSSSISLSPLFLLSPPLSPPTAPHPASPPPPPRPVFLSSTHARFSTTAALKIASGIPASIQREEGGVSAHKVINTPPPSDFVDLSQLPSAFFSGRPTPCQILFYRLELIKVNIILIPCKSY